MSIQIMEKVNNEDFDEYDRNAPKLEEELE